MLNMSHLCFYKITLKLTMIMFKKKNNIMLTK